MQIHIYVSKMVSSTYFSQVYYALPTSFDCGQECVFGMDYLVAENLENIYRKVFFFRHGNCVSFIIKICKIVIHANNLPSNVLVKHAIYLAFADLIWNIPRRDHWGNTTENEVHRYMSHAFIGMVAGCYVISVGTCKAFYSASPQVHEYCITRNGKNINFIMRISDQIFFVMFKNSLIILLVYSSKENAFLYI